MPALADKQPLRQTDDGLQIAFFEQGAAQGACAVLIPSQKSFGDDDGTHAVLLQRFQHQLDEEDGGLAFGGVFAPNIGIGFFVSFRAKGRVGEHDAFAAGQNDAAEFFQCIALLDIAGVDAAHIEIDRGHFAHHAEILDAAHTGAVKIGCDFMRRHLCRMLVKPVFEP